MPAPLKIGFTSFDRLKGVLIVFCAEGLKLGPATEKALAQVEEHFRRAATADRFTGKSGSALEIIAPAGLDLPRLIVVGTGKERELKDRDLVKLGGAAMGRLPAAAAQATIKAEFGAGPLKPEQTAGLALGVRLRAYRFDRYKTKPKEGEERAAEGGGGGGRGAGGGGGVGGGAHSHHGAANFFFPG